MQDIETQIDNEIDIYLKIVECSKAKKDLLIKCDMEGLKSIDDRLKSLNTELSKVISRRDKSLRLRDLVESVKTSDAESARRIEEKRKNIENIFIDLQQSETTNQKLIKHSLKIIEKTFSMISSILIPETASYNTKGLTNKNKKITLSSINEEA